VAAAQAAGRKLGGFPPGPDRALEQAEAALTAAQQAAAQAPPPTLRQANVTDPDSRIMKTPHGWVQGYNAQAIANQHQIVLACDVSQDTNDVLLYQPMMTALADTLAAAGITATAALALADAGYWSEHNATAPGPDRLIATMKDHKQRRAARDLGQTSGPPPADAAPADAMEHRLRTAEGAAAYAHGPARSSRYSQTARRTARCAASAAAASRPPTANGRSCTWPATCSSFASTAPPRQPPDRPARHAHQSTPQTGRTPAPAARPRPPAYHNHNLLPNPPRPAAPPARRTPSDRSAPAPTRRAFCDSLLDYDIFRQGGRAFDAAAIKTAVAQFNMYALQLFQATVSDELLEELR
jgi:hypothetical protein